MVPPAAQGLRAAPRLSLWSRELSLRAASRRAFPPPARSMRSRCSEALRSSTRFSTFERLAWISASRCAVRSVSDCRRSSGAGRARSHAALERLGQRVGALHQGGARLLEILHLPVARASCVDSICASRLSELLRAIVASTDLRSKGAPLLRCGRSGFAALRQGAFRRWRARDCKASSRIVRVVALALVLLARLRRALRQAVRVRRRFSAKLAFDLAELRPGRGQGVLGFRSGAGSGGRSRRAPGPARIAATCFSSSSMATRSPRGGKFAFPRSTLRFLGGLEMAGEGGLVFGERAALRAFPAPNCRSSLTDLRVLRRDPGCRARCGWLSSARNCSRAQFEILAQPARSRFRAASPSFSTE